MTEIVCLVFHSNACSSFHCTSKTGLSSFSKSWQLFIVTFNAGYHSGPLLVKKILHLFTRMLSGFCCVCCGLTVVLITPFSQSIQKSFRVKSHTPTFSSMMVCICQQTPLKSLALKVALLRLSSSTFFGTKCLTFYTEGVHVQALDFSENHTAKECLEFITQHKKYDWYLLKIALSHVHIFQMQTKLCCIMVVCKIVVYCNITQNMNISLNT